MQLLFSTILAMAMIAFAPNCIGSELSRALQSADRTEADRNRDLRSRPDVIISLLNLQPGARVADIFAGAGYYSQLLSSSVGPEGKVLLHNNKAYQSFAAQGLETRFGQAKPENIQMHIAEVTDLNLGIGQLDAAIMVMSYHDLYFVNEADGWPAIDARKFLSQVFAALKPGGRFLIVDHAASKGADKSTAQSLHRIDPDFAQEDIQSHGFELVAASPVLKNNQDDHSTNVFDPAIRGQTDRFVMVFGKPLALTP